MDLTVNMHADMFHSITIIGINFLNDTTNILKQRHQLIKTVILRSVNELSVQKTYTLWGLDQSLYLVAAIKHLPQGY